MRAEVSMSLLIDGQWLRCREDGSIERWNSSQLSGGKWVAEDWSILVRDGRPLIDSRHKWWGVLQNDRTRRGLKQFQCPLEVVED